MSQAITSDYIPEDHAPDPVISHGDATPPGKIAIWLFLASEIMFFVAILGSYIVLLRRFAAPVQRPRRRPEQTARRHQHGRADFQLPDDGPFR